MLPESDVLIGRSEEDIHKIYKLLYEFRNFVKEYQPLLAKEIFPNDRSFFYTKIDDSPKKLLFRLYCSLDEKNKEKLFNVFLRYHQQYTHEEVEIAMNMLRWLVFYTSCYDYNKMIGKTKDLEKEVIYENELQMLDDKQKRKVYNEWLLYKCPSEKDKIDEIVLEENYDSDYEEPCYVRTRYVDYDSDSSNSDSDPDREDSEDDSDEEEEYDEEDEDEDEDESDMIIRVNFDLIEKYVRKYVFFDNIINNTSKDTKISRDEAERERYDAEYNILSILENTRENTICITGGKLTINGPDDENDEKYIVREYGDFI